MHPDGQRGSQLKPLRRAWSLRGGRRRPVATLENTFRCTVELQPRWPVYSLIHFVDSLNHNLRTVRVFKGNSENKSVTWGAKTVRAAINFICQGP